MVCTWSRRFFGIFLTLCLHSTQVFAGHPLGELIACRSILKEVVALKAPDLENFQPDPVVQEYYARVEGILREYPTARVQGNKDKIPQENIARIMATAAVQRFVWQSARASNEFHGNKKDSPDLKDVHLQILYAQYKHFHSSLYELKEIFASYNQNPQNPQNRVQLTRALIRMRLTGFEIFELLKQGEISEESREKLLFAHEIAVDDLFDLLITKTLNWTTEYEPTHPLRGKLFETDLKALEAYVILRRASSAPLP